MKFDYTICINIQTVYGGGSLNEGIQHDDNEGNVNNTSERARECVKQGGKQHGEESLQSRIESFLFGQPGCVTRTPKSQGHESGGKGESRKLT